MEKVTRQHTLLRIRPHHLLCIMFFQNKGYSEDFVVNMQKVKCALSTHDFILTDNADDVCAACPNLHCGKCLTQAKVTRYDAFVTDKCGLTYGKQYSYGQVLLLLTQRILEKRLLCACCGDCEWHGVCKTLQEGIQL